MLELLELKKGQIVLEIGSGSGYVLALLSKIVGSTGKVFGIELFLELVKRSKKTLQDLKMENIEVFQKDGSLGLIEKAPFDRILVSAACPFIPKPLFDQLKEKGVIVAPCGDKFTQMMQIMRKIKGKPIKQDYLETYFAFVPLKGEFGWH